MKTRIGHLTGNETDICVIRTCQTPLHKEVIYEWHWFIQDSTSSFDGEEHRITLCSSCYAHMEQQFIRHVVSSNLVNGYVAYGGSLDEMDKREQERLHPTYISEHLARQP